LDLNNALYCLRFLLMILLLVEMMNQSLGTCPNFGVHFRGDQGSASFSCQDSDYKKNHTQNTLTHGGYGIISKRDKHQ
jgi:hypothetical protein